MKYYLYIAILLGSYTIGRVSHILGGQLKSPHHWIYGAIAIIVGIFFRHKRWGAYLIFFSLGFIVSDLKDMLGLKFYGIDDVPVKRFWGID